MIVLKYNENIVTEIDHSFLENIIQVSDAFRYITFGTSMDYYI